MTRALHLALPLCAALSLLAPAACRAQRAKPAHPASKSAAKPAAKPAPSPAPATVTAANLTATLKGMGLAVATQEGYQRLKVEEEKFGYLVDLRFSESGEWLVCMAHLAPVPDLAKVPAAPLLALLSVNDSLLGMSFSYDRAGAQIMLNESVPAKGLTPGELQKALQRLRGTVLQHQGLWDPAAW